MKKTQARSLLAAMASGSSSIPADLRHCVYRTCMLHCSDGSTQQTLVKMWSAAETPEEKNRHVIVDKIYALSENKPSDIYEYL